MVSAFLKLQFVLCLIANLFEVLYSEVRLDNIVEIGNAQDYIPA